MNKFPSTIQIKNKNNFENIYFSDILSKLRKKIYYNIIKGDENNYFELDIFIKKYYSNNIQKHIKKVCDIIIPELENLGWKCKTSFGNTALFIFSTEKPPSNCWDDNLI